MDHSLRLVNIITNLYIFSSLALNAEEKNITNCCNDSKMYE